MLPACGATIAPAADIVTRLFLSNLPVVRSNKAIAVSVAVAGPNTSPPPPDAAIVIDPVLFVIDMPEPAVSVALVSVLPVVLPISN